MKKLFLSVLLTFGFLSSAMSATERDFAQTKFEGHTKKVFIKLSIDMKLAWAGEIGVKGQAPTKLNGTKIEVMPEGPNGLPMLLLENGNGFLPAFEIAEDKDGNVKSLTALIPPGVDGYEDIVGLVLKGKVIR